MRFLELVIPLAIIGAGAYAALAMVGLLRRRGARWEVRTVGSANARELPSSGTGGYIDVWLVKRGQPRITFAHLNVRDEDFADRLAEAQAEAAARAAQLNSGG